MRDDIMRMVEDGIRDDKIEFLERRVNELENAVNELAKMIPGIIARRERLIRELEGRDMLEVIGGGE